MVRRETCPHCKGNRHIAITKQPGGRGWIKCPSCAGRGYRVRMVH